MAEIGGCKLQASHLFHPPLRIQIESHWYANSDYTIENYRSIASTSIQPLTTYVCMLWNVRWNFFSPYSLYSLTKCLFIKGRTKRRNFRGFFIHSIKCFDGIFIWAFLFYFLFIEVRLSKRKVKKVFFCDRKAM